VEDNIRAWIPRLHFGDTVGTRLVKKFVPGKVCIFLCIDFNELILFLIYYSK